MTFDELHAQWRETKAACLRLEAELMQLRAEAGNRVSLDQARYASKREARAKLGEVNAMIDTCTATAEQKALMRQAVAHMWTRVEQAIGEVRP